MSGKDTLPTDKADIISKRVPELVNAVFSGRADSMVNASLRLKNYTSDEQLRKHVATVPGVLECMGFILSVEVQSDTVTRAKQHALNALVNLLLEEPSLDAWVANTEGLVASVAVALLSNDQIAQELAAKVTDYLCVLEDNRPTVFFEDSMPPAICEVLQRTPSLATTSHLIQALLYLSTNRKLVFALCRQTGFMESISRCLQTTDAGIRERALLVLYHVVYQSPENHVIIAGDGLCLGFLGQLAQPHLEPGSPESEQQIAFKHAELSRAILLALSKNPRFQRISAAASLLLQGVQAEEGGAPMDNFEGQQSVQDVGGY